MCGQHFSVFPGLEGLRGAEAGSSETSFPVARVSALAWALSLPVKARSENARQGWGCPRGRGGRGCDIHLLEDAICFRKFQSTYRPPGGLEALKNPPIFLFLNCSGLSLATLREAEVMAQAGVEKKALWRTSR